MSLSEHPSKPAGVRYVSEMTELRPVYVWEAIDNIRPSQFAGSDNAPNDPEQAGYDQLHENETN